MRLSVDISADVVLLTYPLEYPQADPLANLDFYAIHTSANGPAMTYSNFAVDAAELSVQGCSSFTYLLAGSAPYVTIRLNKMTESLAPLAILSIL